MIFIFLLYKNLLDFEMIWTNGEVLCKVENNILIFGDNRKWNNIEMYNKVF